MPANIDIEQQQITESTTDELRDRLAALRERYDPQRDGGCFPTGGYPMAQLHELHLIEDELDARSERWVADNHTALDRETDIEPSARR